MTVVQGVWRIESVSDGARLGMILKAVSVEWLRGKPDRNAFKREWEEWDLRQHVATFYRSFAVAGGRDVLW